MAGVKVALLVLAGSIALATAATSGRIEERPIKLPNQLGDVPPVDPPQRIAGYFRLNRTEDAHMFYFLFRSRSNSDSDPVILWMTENGPYNLEDNLTLTENPYGWDVNANMIYVDQPINVGFSYSDDPRDRVSTEHQVAEDMLDFLQEFLEVHPELADRDFYVTGESYAGHYVPAVAFKVYAARELGEGAPINIRGAAIGNGLTAPGIQFTAYADYAAENGLMSEAAAASINWWNPPCRWGADLCAKYKWGWLCGLALDYCQIVLWQRVLLSRPGVNVYDIRKECEGPLCYDFSAADAYLNSAGVRTQLGIKEGRTWQSCDMGVHSDFMGDMMRDYQDKLVPLLEDDIRVLIYAGDQDLICNWVGNRRWVDALDWSGNEGWATAPEGEWSVRGVDGANAKAGTAKTYGTLSFVRLYQAGHMVPMDQPASALAMISRWARGEDLTAGEAGAQLPRKQAAGRAAAAEAQQ